MPISLIIMGAAGRMGSTLCRMAREDAAFTLAGQVEHPARLSSLVPFDGCVASGDLGAVLQKVKNAMIIDFTSPESSLATAARAAEYGASQVIGTTGFTNEQRAALEAFAAKAPIFWSPNMSVGVNALLKLLPELVKLLGEEYDLEMTEIHHNRKKDAPSGTALRLAEAMLAARGWNMNDAVCCREGIVGERKHKEMGLQAIRGGDVVGSHTAYFLGPGERIEVTHHAHSRDNFAQGALRAAKWLATQKPGKLYSMENML